MAIEKFQLTRSVGSVTRVPPHMVADLDISTHTFRGERDIFKTFTDCSIRVFQLTRSVGSVTLHIVYVKSHHHNRADILLKITLKSDIFYIICIIFSANLHINQYHCTFAHKIKLPSGSYVSFAPICSTLLFQLLPK